MIASASDDDSVHHNEDVTWGLDARRSLNHSFLAPENFMLRRFTKAARVKALKMEPPSLAQGGLAFILAYTIAYAFFSV